MNGNELTVFKKTLQAAGNSEGRRSGVFLGVGHPPPPGCLGRFHQRLGEQSLQFCTSQSGMPPAKASKDVPHGPSCGFTLLMLSQAKGYIGWP